MIRMEHKLQSRVGLNRLESRRCGAFPLIDMKTSKAVLRRNLHEVQESPRVH